MTTFHKFAQTAENNKKEKTPRSQPPTDNLNENQRQVYGALDKTPKCVDDIVQELVLPVKTVLAVLTQLEIFGMIKVHAGHRFSR